MKKVLLSTFLCFLMIGAFAQNERYLDEVFDNVTVTSEVYGTNGTVLFLPSVGEVVEVPLAMDVYEPEGDTETNRPLVLVFHTGNFLPPILNGQIAGSIQDSSVVEICTQFAKRGFVAAACDYRSGWNPLAPDQPTRALGLIQAAYRGIQDGRTAIRYFKADAAGTNEYGIDTERITTMGLGTGGYLVLGLTGVSDYNEIVNTTNGPGKFLLDTDGDQVPETPMVVESFHGDINGEVLTVVPVDGFGLMAGDTTNYTENNNVGLSNDFRLGINVGGALGDISWLNDNTTPTISIQSPFDIFAPYDDAVLVVPTTNDPIVRVQGAQQIGAAQEANGANSVWDNSVFDDAITMQAIDNSATAGHPYYEGVFPFIRPANSSGLDEGVVMNWWDPNGATPLNSPCMGLPYNQCPTSATDPNAPTFHQAGLALNEGMSAEKSRANIADVMGYILPRACVALDLPCAENFTSSTTDLLDSDVFTASPNPTIGEINIQATDSPFTNVSLFDLSGRLITSQNSTLERNQASINMASLANGVYIMKVQFADGVATRKVIKE